MLPWQRAVRVAVAIITLGAGIAFVGGKGMRGGTRAPGIARNALASVGYQPLGQPVVSFVGEQEIAWALERAAGGMNGTVLAATESGAWRYLVVFPAGGEAEVTEGGVVWSLRRPAPRSPGADLFPLTAGAKVEETLGLVVADSSAWHLTRVHSWREGGQNWQRGWFVGGPGGLPAGWQRELELELVGSTVVAFRRHVLPLGTDLGVVKGRLAELGVLRLPAQLGLGIIIFGLVVAGGEAIAFHGKVAFLRGLGLAVAASGMGLALGQELLPAAGQGLVVGVVFAVLPAFPTAIGRQWAWGGTAGVAIAWLALAGRLMVGHLGGWHPITPALGTSPGLHALWLESWLPAIVQEPLLRGVLPALTAPYIGWWGASLLAIPIGAALTALPAVPLAAGVAVELMTQVVLVVVARRFGVGAAVIARGSGDALLRRAAFPVGFAGDAVALAMVGLSMVVLAWRRPGR